MTVPRPPARLPPQSIESERSVLGSVIANNEIIDDVADIVRPSDFYREGHRLIFDAMLRLVEAREPIDELTLAEALKGDLEKCGGIAYLTKLTHDVPMSINARSYAKHVRDASQARQLIVCSQSAALEAYESKDIAETISRAQASVLQIGSSSTSALEDMKALQTTSFHRYEDRFKNPNAPKGVSTGFTELDEHLGGGLQDSDFVVIAARPSMGKSAFMMALAGHAAVELRAPTLVFSLEMTKEALVDRFNAAGSGVALSKLRTGRLAAEDWLPLSAFMAKSVDAPLFIDDRPGKTIGEICSTVRRLKREKGLRLVLIDQLSKIKLRDDTRANKTERIGEVTTALKDLAKTVAIPIALLVQINRGAEARTDKRPMLSDLKDSGSIEEDADVVAMLYRDEYYNRSSRDKGIAEVILRKQREGPPATVRLGFQGHLTRFTNLAEEDASPPRKSVAPTHAAQSASEDP